MVDTPYDFRNLPLITGHKARQLTALGREVEDHRLLPGSGDIVAIDPSGQLLQDTRHAYRLIELWGMVWPKGPNGEADYTDARYWVRIFFLSQGSYTTVSDLPDFQPDCLSEWGGWLTVTNLAEKLNSTHTLQKATLDADGNMTAAGRIVRCTPVLGRREDDNPFHQWVTDAVGTSDSSTTVGFWAKITSSTEISAGTHRYRYAWTEQEETATGWQDKSGGRSSTDGTGGNPDTRALNSTEANNAATGVQGNSIDHGAANYPATDWFQPVRGNPVVWMRVGSYTTGSPPTTVTTYRFSYVNAEQGAC